ncbi:hypothetical protein D3C84_946210 [compost metagenome]
MEHEPHFPEKLVLISDTFFCPSLRGVAAHHLSRLRYRRIRDRLEIQYFGAVDRITVADRREQFNVLVTRIKHFARYRYILRYLSR